MKHIHFRKKAKQHDKFHVRLITRDLEFPAELTIANTSKLLVPSGYNRSWAEGLRKKIEEESMVAGQSQCVGKLEIVKPKPVGFLCGTFHVPTDATFPSFHSAIVPSPHMWSFVVYFFPFFFDFNPNFVFFNWFRIGAPRYQMLPAETDLNSLPLLSNFPEKVFSAACSTSQG